MNQISTARMADVGNWEWGLAPYNMPRPRRCSRSCTHSIRLPLDMVMSDASEIEVEGMIESRSAASEGSEDALESEGTETWVSI